MAFPLFRLQGPTGKMIGYCDLTIEDDDVPRNAHQRSADSDQPAPRVRTNQAPRARFNRSGHFSDADVLRRGADLARRAEEAEFEGREIVDLTSDDPFHDAPGLEKGFPTAGHTTSERRSVRDRANRQTTDCPAPALPGFHSSNPSTNCDSELHHTSLPCPLPRLWNAPSASGAVRSAVSCGYGIHITSSDTATRFLRHGASTTDRSHLEASSRSEVQHASSRGVVNQPVQNLLDSRESPHCARDGAHSLISAQTPAYLNTFDWVPLRQTLEDSLPKLLLLQNTTHDGEVQKYHREPLPSHGSTSKLKEQLLEWANDDTVPSVAPVTSASEQDDGQHGALTKPHVVLPVPTEDEKIEELLSSVGSSARTVGREASLPLTGPLVFADIAMTSIADVGMEGQGSQGTPNDASYDGNLKQDSHFEHLARPTQVQRIATAGTPVKGAGGRATQSGDRSKARPKSATTPTQASELGMKRKFSVCPSESPGENDLGVYEDGGLQQRAALQSKRQKKGGRLHKPRNSASIESGEVTLEATDPRQNSAAEARTESEYFARDLHELHQKLVSSEDAWHWEIPYGRYRLFRKVAQVLAKEKVWGKAERAIYATSLIREVNQKVKLHTDEHIFSEDEGNRVLQALCVRHEVKMYIGLVWLAW